MSVMLRRALFAIAVAGTSFVAGTAFAQVLNAPVAITDPKKISSKPNAEIEPRGMTIEKLFMTRQVGGATWSPDGKQIAFISNMSGRNNLWIVPADGGFPVQLTVSDQRQSAPAWSPDGKWIAYQSDYDGDEQWDIFLVSPKTGKVVNLTQTRLIAELNPTWSPDGRFLAYEVKAKTSAAYEIDVYDMVMREVKHITSNTAQDKRNEDPIWSKDGKRIVYTQRQAKGTDSNIFIADAETGSSTLLTEHAGEQLYFANDLSPDAKQVLLTSNAEGGYENIGLLALATRKITWLSKEKWQIRGGEFSPDGKRLTFEADVDGNQDIYVRDLGTGKSTALAIAKGVNETSGGHSAFSTDGSRLLYFHNGPTAPSDFGYTALLLESRSKSRIPSLEACVRRIWLSHSWSITRAMTASGASLRFSMCPSIWCGTVRMPPSFTFTVDPHRRPEFVQPLRSVRCESGIHGARAKLSRLDWIWERFQQANLFDMGGGDLQDVLAGVDWIKQTGHLDPKKIAVMGASYGGYLTMMSVTKAPEIWAAGVPIVPFVNWFTEIENEDPVLRQSDLATMGDPTKNKALYEERSPINFIDQIKAPVLLLAGGNDPRCPKSETQQVVDAIKKKGGTSISKSMRTKGTASRG